MILNGHRTPPFFGLYIRALSPYYFFVANSESHFLLSHDTMLVGVNSMTTRCSFPYFSRHAFGILSVFLRFSYFSASIEKTCFLFVRSLSTTFASPWIIIPLSSVYFSPSSTTPQTCARFKMFLTFFL